MAGLNLDAAAEALTVSYRTMKRWRSEGMPAYPTVRGKPVEVELDEVCDWARRNGKRFTPPAPVLRVAPDRAEPSDEPPGQAPAPTLIEARDAAFAVVARGLAEIEARELVGLAPHQLKMVLDIAMVLDLKAVETDRDDELRQRPLMQLTDDVRERLREQFGAA